MHAPQWNSVKSSEIYGSHVWGEPYVHIEDDGDVSILCDPENPEMPRIRLTDAIKQLQLDGESLPVLIRFPSIISHRVKKIQQAFDKAIGKRSYQGKHRLCFPIKTNHRRRVISSLRACEVGLEVGTKAELLIGVSEVLQGRDLPLLCNGYKDREYLDFALRLFQSGIDLTITLENPGEVTDLIDRSEKLGVRPNIGLRLRLSTYGTSRWADSSGDEGMFGLSLSQLIWAVDQLKKAGLENHVVLLHYHIGSQISDYRAVAQAATEATRIYAELYAEGVPIKTIDVGGGLAVEYDGSKSESLNSMNYSVNKYALAIVDAISEQCAAQNVPHPNIYTESGRAVAAHHSIFVFEVFGSPPTHQESLLPESEYSTDLKILKDLTQRPKIDLKQVRSLHQVICIKHEAGLAGVREKAEADRLAFSARIQIEGDIHRMYYGNFSIFQSLPDIWGVNQLFPVMPIHRLDEFPTIIAKISDITCDSDGKFRAFQTSEKDSLPLHALLPSQPYMLGVFNVGAYQETIGDIHNLLARTAVVSVVLSPDGEVKYRLDNAADKVESVLEPVGYVAGELLEEIFEHFEEAVQMKVISEEGCDRLYSQALEIMKSSTYLNLHTPDD